MTAAAAGATAGPGAGAGAGAGATGTAATGATRAAELLYGLPLDQFTAQRNVLAADADDRATTAAIRALPKPSASAWVLDLLVRADSSALDALIAIGDELRTVQATGDRDALAAFSADRRRLVAEVAARAIALGAEARHRVAGTAADDVHQTLQAVVADPDAAAAVLTGRLVRALRTAGFDDVDLDGAIAGVDVGAGVGADAGADISASRPTRAERDEREHDEAISSAERAIAHADEVAARLEHLDGRAAMLETRRGDLGAELEELTDRVAEVESELQAVDRDIRSLRSERERADRAAAAARRTAERAHARLRDFD